MISDERVRVGEERARWNEERLDGLIDAFNALHRSLGITEGKAPDPVDLGPVMALIEEQAADLDDIHKSMTQQFATLSKLIDKHDHEKVAVHHNHDPHEHDQYATRQHDHDYVALLELLEARERAAENRMMEITTGTADAFNGALTQVREVVEILAKQVADHVTHPIVSEVDLKNMGTRIYDIREREAELLEITVDQHEPKIAQLQSDVAALLSRLEVYAAQAAEDRATWTTTRDIATQAGQHAADALVQSAPNGHTHGEAPKHSHRELAAVKHDHEHSHKIEDLPGYDHGHSWLAVATHPDEAINYECQVHGCTAKMSIRSK